MILFAFENYQAMAEKLTREGRMLPGQFRVARFDNGELHVEVQTSVREKDCFLLGTIAPPEHQMLSALLLAHTLKKEGARQVTAVFPYLAYARHDKPKAGESLATAWIGALARVSGIDRVITVDLHSERGEKLFPFPIISLSPARIYAETLHRLHLTDATLVAPDEGAIERCVAVKKAAATQQPVVFFEKHRTPGGIEHRGISGSVGRQAVLIDDILDTGSTLVSACQRLRQAGVQDIDVMVTHGLFTGERWRGLWIEGVRRIFCTNSVPPVAGANSSRIKRLSVIPLLEQELLEGAFS